jgi:hypothetical protein
MLLHIDGSKHRWLNDDRWHDLMKLRFGGCCRAWASHQ